MRANRGGGAIVIEPVSEPARSELRAHARLPEAECVAQLLREAPLSPAGIEAAQRQARGWIETLRERRARGSGVDALMRQFSLSSQEGIALMCLAEALARVPDRATVDALIRDKLAQGDWQSHVGASPSLFVNAAAWGLMITGKLVATHSQEGLGAAVGRVVARGGEPMVRAGVELAMRMLGQQFVLGSNIEQALSRSREAEVRGYRHSYDMLGEAALTAHEAQRYLDAYAGAIEAIGASIAGGGGAIHSRPGISVKLSALHPRFTSLQGDRVLHELMPRLQELCRLARHQGIGLNIDAEESERLEPTLDLFARLAADPALGGWDGLGIVVQAYQRRALALCRWLAELAQRHGRRFPVRLVKGAYWDSEIKRSQIEGYEDFPVFTRKAHTDASYLVCARELLAQADRVYPQFATHNALSLAMILQMAQAARVGDFEFQCLHGMGESLYDLVLGPDGPGVPCRIYAPVGPQETLLAYLVRRLLENGANSSFVHRVLDDAVSIEELLSDPLVQSRQSGGAPHPAIAAPAKLFAPERRNSRGLDFFHPPALEALDVSLRKASARNWSAYPLLASGRFDADGAPALAQRSPARPSQVVGSCQSASDRDIEGAIGAGLRSPWGRVPPEDRARILEAVADALESRRDEFIWLIGSEAGRTEVDAVSEVREAADFCRYYAVQARRLGAVSAPADGPLVAISPWNFPLAIFTGQIAAALAAGRSVLAKPAEQTPLVAAHAVRLMHAAGVPADALQLLPGDGAVGAKLVAHGGIGGVLFTGSTEVASLIDRSLAVGEASWKGLLVAETGGQNAMIVDSSAQPEQVVQDALLSAFGSAGQRCSALRVLCVQEEVADAHIQMLVGAARELRLGDPLERATDVGPVIDAPAARALESYLARIPPSRLLFRASPAAGGGNFVAPAIVRIDAVKELGGEVFGPVLHVLRYRREALGELIDELNATGFALTCGVHSRIDETIDFVAGRIRAGNVYVNRNMIGAVVGVQPFGGEGLSGTGPKAGGPWTVPHLRAPGQVAAWHPRDLGAQRAGEPPLALRALIDSRDGLPEAARRICDEVARETPLGWEFALAGPTGESNTLRYRARGRVLCLCEDAGAADQNLWMQVASALATGNLALLVDNAPGRRILAALPESARAWLAWCTDWHAAQFEAMMFHGAEDLCRGLRRELAAREGARIPLVRAEGGRYRLERLVSEQVVTVNTAAAGGNASLMTLAPA
jgi:RHH-type transcriptional regulator, proline utilization regulon repressor / proline dehydrogenase / delta 1-pyrroline-5-carboxylate dehydrogenase